MYIQCNIVKYEFDFVKILRYNKPWNYISNNFQTIIK